MAVEHKDAAIEKRHAAHNWEYADAAARAAAAGLLPADVGKLSRQLDTNALYLLTDDSPVTWQAVGAGIGTTINSTNTCFPYRSSSSAFADSPLFREDADTISQRNGSNAQILNVYGTYTDGSNYTRLSIAPSATGHAIAAETAGTGQDDLSIAINPAGVGMLTTTRGWTFSEISAPATPAANKVSLYAKSDGLLYSKDDAGTETLVSGGAGGGGSGTVNAGAQYAVAYYPSAGTTVDDLGNLTTDASGVLSHATTARTTGNPTFYNRIVTPADTGLTAATESVGIQLGGNTSGATVTRTFTAAGSWTIQREIVAVGPTYSAASATTIPDAVTFDVSPPIAAGSMVLTRSTAIRAHVTATAHHGFWAEMASGANGDAFYNTVAGTKVFRVAQVSGETNVVVRANGDVSTSATDGFLYLSQFSAFTKPTGTPTTYAGAPIVVGKDATFGWHGLWGFVNSGWVDFSGIFTRHTSSTGTGAQTIAWDVWGAHITRKFTAGAGNVTFTFTAPQVLGTLLSLIFIQDSTGSRTITFPASVFWPSGVAVQPTITANARTVYLMTWDGTNYNVVSTALDVK